MHPYVMTIPTLEAELFVLYSTENLDDKVREVRAHLARAYHDRTGKWFAARFY
jgi:hypothetical protein